MGHRKSWGLVVRGGEEKLLVVDELTNLCITHATLGPAADCSRRRSSLWIMDESPRSELKPYTRRIVPGSKLLCTLVEGARECQRLQLHLCAQRIRLRVEGDADQAMHLSGCLQMNEAESDGDSDDEMGLWDSDGSESSGGSESGDDEDESSTEDGPRGTGSDVSVLSMLYGGEDEDEDEEDADFDLGDVAAAAARAKATRKSKGATENKAGKRQAGDTAMPAKPKKQKLPARSSRQSF